MPVKKYLILKAAEPEDLGEAYAESLPTISGYEENLTPTLPTIVKVREMDESQVEEVRSRAHVLAVEEDVEDQALFETPGVAFEGPSEGIETVDALEYHEILAARAQSPVSNVTVAVLDTGIKSDTVSGLLKGQVVDQKSFIDGEAVEDSVSGHGDFCSVAATRGGAKLLVGKVLRNSGSGPRSSILAGIDWAVRSGANVISMSLGSASTSEAYDAAISGARSRGVIVFAAAGNGGRQNQPVNAPGNCKDAVCVGAIDHRNERIADFSCKGPEVDVAAAGVDISYRGKSWSGTSMSTPLSVAAFSTVRGAVENPALALKAFFSGCKDTPAPVEAEGLGVPKALKAIQSTKPAPPIVLPEKDKPPSYYPDLPRIPAYATAKWIGTKAVLTRGGHEAGYYEPKPVVSRELEAVIDSEYCECEGGCC